MRHLASLVSFSAYLFSAAIVTGASYDCSRAVSDTEIAICNEFNLSVDDRVLSFLHGQRLRFPESSRDQGNLEWFNATSQAISSQNEAIAEQADWLAQTRNPCGNNIECLQNSYDARIDEFLEVVRIEPADSHGGNRTNFGSRDAEKEALRLVASIFENIDRHNLFPNFHNGEAFFSLYGPNYFATVETPVFHENTKPSLQGPLDWSVEVEYSGLVQCLSEMTLDDVKWSGLPSTLSTSAELGECMNLHWGYNTNANSGTFLFPHVWSRYITDVEHPLQTAYSGLCDGYPETQPACSDPNRRSMIEAIENMASWAITRGYANEQTISLILETWKMDYLVGPISELSPSQIRFEERSIGVINTLFHMSRFPNNLDFQRCRFNLLGELVCPTIEMSQNGALTISGSTDICQIDNFQYRVLRQGSEYELHIDGANLVAPLIVPMRRRATGTGVCTYQYLETIPTGQISLDFGAGCFPNDYEPPATFSIYIRDDLNGPISPSVLSTLPGGECQLQFSGQFGGHLD